MSDNLREQLLLLPAYFQGHLLLTLAAISMGVLISVPLGVWAEQSARVKRPLLAVVSIIQTFPTCLHRADSLFDAAYSAQHGNRLGIGIRISD